MTYELTPTEIRELYDLRPKTYPHVFHKDRLPSGQTPLASWPGGRPIRIVDAGMPVACLLVDIHIPLPLVIWALQNPDERRWPSDTMIVVPKSDPDNLMELELIPRHELAAHPSTLERARRTAEARTEADRMQREEEAARDLLARIARDRKRERIEADERYAAQENRRKKLEPDDPFEPGAASPPPPVYDDAAAPTEALADPQWARA